MKKWFLLVMLLFFTGLALHGQETNSIVQLYEKYTLKTQFEYWKGLEVVRNCDNKVYNASLFGIDADLNNLLMNSPSSKIAMEGYSSDMFWGNLLYWGGIAIMCSDIVLLAADPHFIDTGNGEIAYLGILTAGAATSLVSIGFVYSGQNKVYDAIWQYNKDIMSGTTRVSMNKDERFGVVLNTHF